MKQNGRNGETLNQRLELYLFIQVRLIYKRMRWKYIRSMRSTWIQSVLDVPIIIDQHGQEGDGGGIMTRQATMLTR